MLLLEREINRARHGNGHLVLAYIDVDGLKQVNDSHGHGAGDALLRDVAGAIQKHLRSYDTLVRVGGDEFVCALGDCTPAVANIRFEEIRATLQQLSRTHRSAWDLPNCAPMTRSRSSPSAVTPPSMRSSEAGVAAKAWPVF